MIETTEILKVKIFGTEYPLRVQSDANYIRAVASYVDKKMREVYETKPERTPFQIAILAALNITDELMQAKGKQEGAFSELEQRLRGLTETIEIGIQSISEDLAE